MNAASGTGDTAPPADPAAGGPDDAAAAAKPARAARSRSKPAAASPRRRAREAAVQGLYAWLIGGADAPAIDAQLREFDEAADFDREHFDALLHGCIAEAATLDAVIGRHADRRTERLSPVEHAVLMIGVYELQHCLDVPYRVVINEAVEVCKRFGGTDGHKYVNGVLDKAAVELRSAEGAGRRR